MKISTVLIATLIVTALNVSAEQFGDFSYIINPNVTNLVTITGYTGAGGSVVIPSVIDSKSVISIASSAFERNTDLTSVTIPNSVQYIGESTFLSCINLDVIEVVADNPVFSSSEGILFNKTKTTLIQYPGGRIGSYTIPDSVTSIWNYAFQSCINLDAIEVATDNPAFSSSEGILFNKTKTTLIQYPGGRTGSYTIPDSVTTINISAFSYCTGLTFIFIPSSITAIGGPTGLGYTDNTVFSYCSNLIAITVDPNNPAYSSAGGILFNKSQTKLIEYPGGRTGSYSVPDGVTRIGNHAFRDCSLTSVMIPASVDLIGFWPGGFNSAVRAFDFCSNLTNITVATDNPYYRSIDGVLFEINGEWEALLEYPGGRFGSYTIPDSTKLIEDNAFISSINLTSVTIPDNVLFMGQHVFAYCTSLTTITIPDSITGIGSYAFAYCTSLTTITIPDSITGIGSRAFAYCTSLTTITIPGSIFEIWHNLFENCANLTGVYFQGNAPLYASEPLGGGENMKLYYKSGTTGWDSTFLGLPTVLWNPLIQTDDDNFGIQAGAFGFNITESDSGLVVVETCTNLTAGLWVPTETNSMNNGTVYFSDSDWTNHPNRYYRLNMP